MKSKILHEQGGLRTFALVFDTGEEIMDALAGFARDEQLTAAQFTAKWMRGSS